MCIRNGIRSRSAFWNPLCGSCGALGLHPLERIKIRKVLNAPLGRGCSPCAFEATGDRVTGLTGTALVLPTKPLLFNSCSCRGSTHAFGRISFAVSLPEAMPTCDQCDSLFIIHRHATKGLANVFCCSKGIRVSVWTFRIHIDQSHLNCGKRVLELAFAFIALICKKLALRSPVNQVRFPVIHPTTGKSKGFKAHGFERHVSGKNHQIRP